MVYNASAIWYDCYKEVIVMSAKPEIVYEYDNYAIDASKLPSKPRPHEEVMRELEERLNEIDAEYTEKETA